MRRVQSSLTCAPGCRTWGRGRTSSAASATRPKRPFAAASQRTRRSRQTTGRPESHSPMRAWRREPGHPSCSGPPSRGAGVPRLQDVPRRHQVSCVVRRPRRGGQVDGERLSVPLQPAPLVSEPLPHLQGPGGQPRRRRRPVRRAHPRPARLEGRRHLRRGGSRAAFAPRGDAVARAGGDEQDRDPGTPAPPPSPPVTSVSIRTRARIEEPAEALRAWRPPRRGRRVESAASNPAMVITRDQLRRRSIALGLIVWCTTKDGSASIPPAVRRCH